MPRSLGGGVILPGAIYYPEVVVGKVGFEPTRAQRLNRF